MRHLQLAGPDGVGWAAIEARRVVDQRTVELARLRWVLDDQANRMERGMRWVMGGAPRPDAPSPNLADAGRVTPPEVDRPNPPQDGRRLSVTVSESREVTLTVEDKIPAPMPVIEHPRRLAS